MIQIVHNQQIFMIHQREEDRFYTLTHISYKSAESKETKIVPGFISLEISFKNQAL